MTQKPKYFSFSITERCQSHCTTCNGWQTTHGKIKDELSTDDWKFVLLEMQKWIGNFDFIFGGGEPFVREDIFDIADYADSIGLIPKVITNGLGLKNKCKKLINSGFQDITISLNAVKNPNIHNISRGRKDAFKITTDVIQNLAYLNRKLKKPKKLLLSSIIMPTNISELVPLSVFAQQNGMGVSFQLMEMGDAFFSPQTYLKNFGSMFDEIKIETVESIEKLKQLKREGYLIYNTDNQLDAFKEVIINSLNKDLIRDENEREIPIFAREGFNYSERVTDNKINKEIINQKGFSDYISEREFYTEDACRVGYRNFAIDPYGNVRICFSLETIGSLREDLPQNIWNSERADKLREKIMNCNKSCKLLNCNYD